MKLSETNISKLIIDKLGDIEVAPKDVVTINDEVFIKIGLASKIIGRSTQTIKHWYEYAKTKGIYLPEMYTNIDKRGTRYFKENDLAVISKFADNVTYGSMSDYNIKLWGEKGKTIESKQSTRYKSDRSNKLSSDI
jgi:hypothetical protein